MSSISPSGRRFRETESPAARVLCFPHAGGGASFYSLWSRLLPTTVDVIAVQYPGHEDRLGETPAVRLGQLVDEFESDIAELFDVPMVLLGHSMGALVAHEVARRFETSGTLVHLVLSGARHPAQTPRSAVHHYEDEALLSKLEQLGGSTEALRASLALRQLMLPMLRTDFELVHEYQAPVGDQLKLPITAVVGAEDAEVSVSDAQGWSTYTTGTFTLEIVPGGHFALSRPDVRSRVGKLVTAALSNQLSRGPTR